MAVSTAFISGFLGSFCTGTSACLRRRFQRGEIIYAIGEESRTIYYISNGSVKITTLSKNGREMILSIRKEKEIFGESSLFQSQYPEMAVAMEPCEIAEIRTEDLINRLLHSQDGAYQFLLSVIGKLSEAYEIIGEVSLDAFHARLTKVLLRLAEKFGDDVGSATQLDRFITQEDIAHMASASREAVSSALKEFRTRGLINYTRRGKLVIYRQRLINELLRIT